MRMHNGLPSIGRVAKAGTFALVVVWMFLPVAPALAGDDWSARPSCGADCPILHVSGALHESGAGSIATPIGTTYSVHHMLGADVDEDGDVDCRLIYNLELPGAPDDIVTYDGTAEAIRTDVRGTVPTVTESKVDNADGTHRIVIDTSAPTGRDLFPGGILDLGTGTPLTDACFFIGLDDRLSWEGLDIVTAATVSFLKDGAVVAGPFDVSGPSHFSVPWNGFFGMTVDDVAGIGINRVHMEIRVGKEPQGILAACCLAGQCLGNVESISCDFQGGRWHVDASCGTDPTRPPPVCNHAPYLYNNGFPLDDGGAPVSQYAPDAPFFAAAADDFIIAASGGSPFIRVTSLWAWVGHSAAGVDPRTAYNAVNVTVYTDAAPKGPAGRPNIDGSHSPTLTRGIRYSQTIPIGSITVTSAAASCVLDIWKLDIPVNIVLEKNTKYWLEVQPVMAAARGHVRWLYSQRNNDHRARRIGPTFGIDQWQEVPGNTDACLAATPPAGTRLNLAFQLYGSDLIAPPNDNCADALTISEGVVAFSTLGATTDGPEMPEEPAECRYAGYNQVGSDIWFEHTAACGGDLTVSLCGSQFDTKVAIYDDCGACPPRVPPIACNEDYCNVQSEVTLPATEGKCYRIRVGGWMAAQGMGLLTVDCYEPPPPTGACCDRGVCLGTMTEPECQAADGDWYYSQTCQTFTCPVPPPTHDECYRCIPIPTGGRYTGRTDGASGTDISSCGFNDTRDVWHCWTPGCTGSAIIGLCESEGLFDTTLAVYDRCGGDELSCSDDYCGPMVRKSLISPHQLPPVDLWVTAGKTYYIRVAGRNASVGSYTLTIDDCANACCSSTGLCRLKTQSNCTSVNGFPQGDGTTCLGDDNMNGVDDVCEGCPAATITASDPPDGVVDARQPNAPGSALPRQGIGSPAEPILVALDPPASGAEDCFVLCETAVDPLAGANDIAAVTYVGSGTYSITLDRAITVGAVTTIQYAGDGSYVVFTSHPANVNGDSMSAPSDILRVIDYLNHVAVSPWGIYSEDVDRSNLLGPPDILRVIDLLNGAGAYDPWLNTPLPQNASCPE